MLINKVILFCLRDFAEVTGMVAWRPHCHKSVFSLVFDYLFYRVDDAADCLDCGVKAIHGVASVSI